MNQHSLFYHFYEFSKYISNENHNIKYFIRFSLGMLVYINELYPLIILQFLFLLWLKN